MRKSALLGTWPYDRDKMQIREHDSFTCLTSSKDKGARPSQLVVHEGIHSAVKSRCRKFYFLFLPREKYDRISQE